MERTRPTVSDDPDAPTNALVAFMDREGLGTGPLSVTPIVGGHSNLTFLLTRDDCAIVLRRPPRPPYARSAHNVVREAAVLCALAGRARAPRVLAVCEQEHWIGAPFYLMERVPGIVITDRMPEALDAAGAHDLSEQLVDLLGELHELDPAPLAAARLARPGSYIDRQLRRFAKLWADNQTRPVPDVDIVGKCLADSRPMDTVDRIVHGDFRLGNVMVTLAPVVTIAGLLDWEMAAIGDPLVDLGYLLAAWPDDALEPTVLTEIGAALAAPGCLTRAQAAERYRESHGVDRPLDWYIAFAQWKAAIFLEGSRRRFLAGTTEDPFYAGLDVAVPRLAAAAREQLRRPGRPT